ncbi:Hypothetical protein (Fragment) [Durusdinium trenchii]|uniref:PDZ domain-containing protein n=1 Tax=Durusdinium trenchii TaxID=1381693 RepID=A0ABP0Q7N6_9DINO
MIVDGLLSLPAIAKEWTVVLKKHPGASLGMDVDMCDASSLIVYVVCETGLVADWNQANPAKSVQKGDRIIEVNQKKGDAWALAHECIDSPELRMQVQRSDGCILKL